MTPQESRETFLDLLGYLILWRVSKLQEGRETAL